MQFLTPKQKPQLPGSYQGAFWSGLRWGGEGNLLAIPFIAMEAATAQRGEVLPTAIGRGTGLLTYPALAGIMAFGVSMIPGVNIAAAGLLGGVLAMYPNTVIEDGMIRGIRTLTSSARQMMRLNFGGSYEDSMSARQQRMLALQSIGASMQASRRFLGQEALFMHR